MRFPVVFATALVALGLSASGANACNLNGAFIVAFQSNDTIVTFDGIAQIGEEIAGNAAFRDVRGHFRGIMKRNGILSFVTEWNDGTQGAYTAQVTDDGRLSDGRTFEVGNPDNSASWGLGASANRLRCN